MYKNHNKLNNQKSATKSNQIKFSILKKAFTRCSQWDDKDEFLDVIYWSRQIIGIIAGIIWGLIPLKGFFGIALSETILPEVAFKISASKNLFLIMNAGLLYIYFSNFQKIDEEEYGGPWELTKEGFMSSFAGFLVIWIIIYTGVHFN